MSSTTIVLITLIIYKLGLIGVGLWASRRVTSEQDFFLADHSNGGGLGAWVAGLSYAASTSSAWVLLGFTGTVFTKGMVGLWLVPGIFFGYVMTWFIIGPRLNADTQVRGHLTIIDFITADMDAAWKRKVGFICGVMILFCFIFYMSPQFQAAANGLNEIFGLGIVESILLGAFVIVLYCLLGGFWAASVTDAFQALVMMLACILVPIAAVNAAGGFGAIVDTLHAHEPRQYFSFTGEAVGLAGVGVAMGLFGTGFGAMGQPQLLNRIMAVKSASERRKGALITIGWGVVIYTGLVCLALSARALQMDVDGEKLFFAAAESFLPPIVAGIVIAAVLSAVMSTVDSLLLAAASAVSHDMGFTYDSPKQALFFGRVAMVVIAILAVLLTLFLPKDIFSRVLFSWVALGAAFGPSILVKCLGWRVKSAYVFAAIIIGFFIAVIFANISGTSADMVEKWGSWIVGLTLLLVGRERRK